LEEGENAMKQNLTIGVLTPLFDGFYFGGLLSSIHKTVRGLGARVVAVQTMDEAASESAVFDYPVGWDHIDGWIVIINAVSERYLEKLKLAGKPIVSIAQVQSVDCPSVLCDNVNSTAAAVRHLIDHGHRHIAFIGNMTQLDIDERYQGYCAALSERGIPCDPNLVFTIDDNIAQGGKFAAERILQAGVPCTAIAASTDLNAMGLINALQAAGYRVPDDIAVIGFDDIEMASCSNPPLTTVRQPIDGLGAAAARLLLKQIAGEEVAAEPCYIGTQLIIRHSCGCPAAPAEPAHSGTMYNDPFVLRSYMESAIESRAVISLKLLQSTSESHKDMSWLEWTKHHWGFISLWSSEDDGCAELAVDRAFSSKGDVLPPLGTRRSVEAFPPMEYMPPSTGPGGDDIIKIYFIRSELRSLGVFVFVGPVNSELMMGYDTRQWSSLLGPALERERLYAELKLREKRYRAISEQLEIVSRTTNDGIWDWDLHTNRIELNERLRNILDIPIDRSVQVERFADLVHPADLPHVIKGVLEHLEKRRPYQYEYRICNGSGEYIWVSSAGEALFDPEGKPYRMIGSITDITKRKKAEEQIYHMAFHDPLTGLSNRSYFHEKLSQAVKEARKLRRKKHFAVMLLDLDRFKTINDSLGHQVGDQLLQFVAGIIKKHVGEANTVARLGGDEFIALLNDIENKAQALAIANKILQSLQAPFVIEKRELFITTSIGISLFPTDGDDPDTLMKSADIAMYRAKHQGKNQAETYTPSMLQLHNKRFEAID
jgi:diguanylate cyclase (GGDEF)-like protein/PAS domain S-box-containing protein